MKENGNFQLGEIISRAQSTSCSKRKEASSFWNQILYRFQTINLGFHEKRGLIRLIDRLKEMTYIPS